MRVWRERSNFPLERTHKQASTEWEEKVKTVSFWGEMRWVTSFPRLLQFKWDSCAANKRDYSGTCCCEGASGLQRERENQKGESSMESEREKGNKIFVCKLSLILSIYTVLCGCEWVGGHKQLMMIIFITIWTTGAYFDDVSLWVFSHSFVNRRWLSGLTIFWQQPS